MDIRGLDKLPSLPWSSSLIETIVEKLDGLIYNMRAFLKALPEAFSVTLSVSYHSRIILSKLWRGFLNV
jgi:hypothetical protein